MLNLFCCNRGCRYELAVGAFVKFNGNCISLGYQQNLHCIHNADIVILAVNLQIVYRVAVVY